MYFEKSRDPQISRFLIFGLILDQVIIYHGIMKNSIFKNFMIYMRDTTNNEYYNKL